MRLWQALPRLCPFPAGWILLFTGVTYGCRDEGAEHASILGVI